jgi:hypothetical protein
MPKIVPITIDACPDRQPLIKHGVAMTHRKIICFNEDSLYHTQECNFDEFPQGCPYYNRKINTRFIGL